MEIANTRRRLLLGSALAVTSLFVYGRSAYAACTVTVAPSYECSGSNAVTQSILNVTDADVSTLPGFSVNAAAGNGIEISGDGEISFIDYNNSSITGQNNGLQIIGYDGAGVDNVFVDVDGSVAGGLGGIVAVNFGSGDVQVLVNGDVAGAAASGINASNINGANLTIITSSGTAVTGGVTGINALNNGSGSLSIVANGDVTGLGEYAIYAGNINGTNLFVTTGAGSTAQGSTSGVVARHYGSGELEITANGDVTGAANYGIDANSFNGTNLTVITDAGTSVTGGEFGIKAFNYGSNFLNIVANGDVTGTDAFGIYAHNFNGSDLIVTTGAGSTVTGEGRGISAANFGTGSLDINANGDVTGIDATADGISAINTLAGTDVTVAIGGNTTVIGGQIGIRARNNGTGQLAITTNGDLIGTNGYGIFATTDVFGTDLTVTIGANSTVAGGVTGVFAHNRGSGVLEITTNGDVAGAGTAGIYAINDLAGTGLKVTTGANSSILGAAYGIKTANTGTGIFEIIVGGQVSTTGLIPYGSAIVAYGSSATIDGLNTSNIVGRVTTGGGDDLFTNAGVWESLGPSNFGAGTNAVTNSGMVRTSFNGGMAELAIFENAGTFTNTGTISLSDETGGNGSQTHDELTIDGDFAGGGILQLDAYLGGAGSAADLLIITGNVSGVTQLQVLNTSTGGAANLDGIALVLVNGTSAAGDFVLANGPISAGLFTYDLQFDVANSVHELVSNGAAAASAELATFASAAQSIWYDTLGVVDERFDELHSGIRAATIVDDGILVQPASDMPNAQPGLWGKLIGRTTDRDASSSVDGVTTDISYGLDTTGFVFGVDGAIDSFILGATGGYINANQDFDSGSAASYEGFVGGLYATYVSGNFHLNGQFNANVLDLGYTMAGTPGTSQADMVTLGAALEAGYRLNVTDRFYTEPVAQLAYADSSTHNGDALGTAFTAEGESLRGGIGLNLGGQINGSGIIFKPELALKVWGEFEGNNSAAFSAFVVADDMPDVFGEVGLSIEMASLANGWSGNLKGDAQFAEDFISFGGYVGLRKNF